MPTITAIEKQKRGRRANVHLDGEYALSLRLDLIGMAHLDVGAELPPSQRRRLEAEDQRLGAIESALRLLAVGPRSERDLRERLRRRRGFRDEAVDAAIQRMQELGYLDDGAFARFWVESRQAGTPRSRRALAFELSRKGVGRDELDAALEGVSDADAAYDAAQRRLRALRGADKQTFERKLASFLNTRGFGYGVARATIQRCWAEVNEESGDA
ncbi:MAG TPA: regulatory protein RecX [Dehalococcoidia bacterium]|nr:regulatory protein RecX [Dehalococcoidia bacterium]